MNVANHKAQIAEQATTALAALDTFAECADLLDTLLYAVRYHEGLEPLASDAVETAYYTLGQHMDAIGALHTALRELRDETAEKTEGGMCTPACDHEEPLNYSGLDRSFDDNAGMGH